MVFSPGAAIQAATSFGGAAIGQIGVAMDAQSEQDALRRNAVLARMAATAAIQRGQLLGSRVRTQAGKLRASQQAQFAQAGVAVGEGTAAQVEAETTALSEQDAQILRSNAAMEAFGFREKADQFDQAIKTSKRRTLISGVQSILGGSSGVASAFLK